MDGVRLIQQSDRSGRISVSRVSPGRFPQKIGEYFCQPLVGQVLAENQMTRRDSASDRFVGPLTCDPFREACGADKIVALAIGQQECVLERREVFSKISSARW